MGTWSEQVLTGDWDLALGYGWVCPDFHELSQWAYHIAGGASFAVSPSADLSIFRHCGSITLG
jgi:hypothetical protein